MRPYEPAKDADADAGSKPCQRNASNTLFSALNMYY